MEYNFRDIEVKWRKIWANHKTFKAEDVSDKPKFYGLDMFPYPSGAGLHVGHPLGYIASDIYARYKRLKGFNVLHPMGYDSFGLPAEQYAIQTGQHPAITTEKNLARYREQLDKIGFSFDWDREVQTSNPNYYKWTQWIFKQLYNSWYNQESDKADDISNLVIVFENEGNSDILAVTSQEEAFTAEQWNAYSEVEQQAILMNYRLTYLADSWVNWCPELGTVLANDEIKDGVSERGGHPVEQKLMRQWSMRITAYAERLINGLETVDWTDSIKEQQRNWIGKSVGASVKFKVLANSHSEGSNALAEEVNGLRNDPTEAELLLWKELKGKKLGIKFRKDHIINEFVIDFVCLAKKLVIKIGDLNPEDKTTETLESLGYKVLYFSEDEILNEIEGVRLTIQSDLKNRPDFNESADENSNASRPKLDEYHIEVFTTRPDTIFGVNFIVLAPEHELVEILTTPEYQKEVKAYQKQASLKTERDRQADVKNITGQFIGAYAIHPFTGEKVQIWIGDYVLAGYGTGAVMAVPAGDQRDWDFAKHFNIEIKNIFEDIDISEGAYTEKGAKLTNSGFLDGMSIRKGLKLAIHEIEKQGFGKGQTNFRLRDAVFSRQRYWGEPFPVYYKDNIPYLIEDGQLPVTLPEVDAYLPTEDGEPPLARAKKEAWNKFEGDRMEYNTMPGWAGSSWYFLRYMDPHNENEFVSKEKADYWNQVDLYIGGSEHATGHLLYSRFWTKFLSDKGFISFDEPFKKMINQGMILGRSSFLYKVVYDVRISDSDGKLTKLDHKFPAIFISKLKKDILIADFSSEESKVIQSEIEDIIAKVIHNNLGDEIESSAQHLTHLLPTSSRISINYVDNDVLNIQLAQNDPLFSFLKDSEFIYEDNGEFVCGHEIDKMSKTYYNVQTPDELVDKFGADTLRCYEMFLGPLEQAKPWDTKGISGVHNFLRKFWRLFHNENNEFVISEGEVDKKALKTLHKTIKKLEEDLERFSFNTGVSNFMIAVNELTEQKCNNKAILSDLVKLISPYAPHICEELWEKLGYQAGSISYAEFPVFNPDHLVESEFAYPVSFNGKMRFKLELPTSLGKDEIEKAVLDAEQSQKWLEGKAPKKMIVVPGRIVNIVV